MAKKNSKNTERRAGLLFDRILEKLNYPKRFTDNIEKKIKDDLFFIKTIDLGPRRSHGIFHGNLSSICRVYFMPHWFTLWKFIFKFSITGKKHSFPMFDPKILMKFT